MTNTSKSTNDMTQATSSISTRTSSGMTVAFIACALLALLVLGGALYVQLRNQQQNQIQNGQTHLQYCDQSSFERAQLPLQAQSELTRNCAAQPTAEATP